MGLKNKIYLAWMFLRGILFSFFYGFGTLLLSLFMFLIFWVPRPLFSFFVRAWCYYFSFCAFIFLGIRYSVEGIENIPSEGAVLFAVKHQSLWETMVLNCIFKDVAFVLKEELLKIPFFGPHLRKMKNIAINRKDGIKALKYMHQKSVNMLLSGRSLVIFPEGTRVEPHVKGKKYHTGIYSIYKEAGVSVVPIALNSGYYWKRGMIKRPGVIKVKIMPPIQPGEEKSYFMSHLKDLVEDESYKLYEEALNKK